MGAELRLFLLLVVGSALLRLLFVPWGEENTSAWALSFVSFLPMRWEVLLALALPLATPLVMRSKMEMPLPTLLFAMLGMVGIAALLAPVTFPLLGDGALYASEILRIIQHPDTADALLKPSSWVTGWVVKTIALLWRSDQVLFPYRVLGILGWILAVGGGIALFRRPSLREGGILAVLLFFSPALVFFFGYVELYVLSFVLTALFLLALWGMLVGHDSPVLPAFLLVGAVACGAAALVFVPMFLGALVLTRTGTGSRWTSPRLLGATALLVTAGLALAYGLHSSHTLHPFLIPLAETEIHDGVTWQGVVRYSMFSFAHLADIANILILTSLPALILLISARPRRSFLADPAVGTGLLGALGALLLLLFGNSTFGWARDWDLATIPSTAFAFLAAAIVHWRWGKDGERMLLPGLLLLGVSVSLPWIQLVRDAPSTASFLSAQVQRLEGVVLPQANANGDENLRKFYQVAKMDSARDAVLDRMLRNGYQRETTIAEMLNRMRGLPPGALRQERIHALLTGLKSVPTADPTRRFDHVSDHVKLEAVAEALFLLLDEGAIGEARTWWESFSPSFAGTRDHDVVNLLIGPPRSAMERWATLSVDRVNAIRVPRYLLRASTLRYAAGNPEGALTLLERTLALDSTGFPAAYLAAAKIQFESRQNPNDARALLQRCIRLCPTAPEARTAESILTRLSRE